MLNRPKSIYKEFKLFYNKCLNYILIYIIVLKNKIINYKNNYTVMNFKYLNI